MGRIIAGATEKGLEKRNSLCCCENMAGVSADCIYRTVMSFHLPNLSEGVHIPELEGASSAAAEQNWSTSGQQTESTHPVFMSIRNLLKDRKKANLTRMKEI